MTVCRANQGCDIARLSFDVNAVLDQKVLRFSLSSIDHLNKLIK